MRFFAWTKLQDFCLRLALLKVVVAFLPCNRSSTSRDLVLRRISQLLFEPKNCPLRLQRAAERVYGERPGGGFTAADALLFISDSPSWGQPIHLTEAALTGRGVGREAATTYKILEWAQVVSLVTPGMQGNQLTERGLLLRTLMPTEPVEAFVKGDVEAWNPFVLTPQERLFLCYHLFEHDELSAQMVVDLGRRASGTQLEPAEVRRVMSSALAKVIARARGKIPLADVPRLSKAAELAQQIEREVNPSGPQRVSAPRRPVMSKRGTSARVTRMKNADHQTIPRCEQLIDLGFLTRPEPPRGAAGRELRRARNAWTYVVTEQAARFCDAFGVDGLLDEAWLWSRFGQVASASGMDRAPQESRPATIAEAVEVFFTEYERIARPAGHTPFESVAILAVVRALSRGLVIEVRQLHQLMLTLKTEGTFDKFLFFASGNEVDRMFILAKPELRQPLVEWCAARGRA